MPGINADVAANLSICDGSAKGDVGTIAAGLQKHFASRCNGTGRKGSDAARRSHKHQRAIANEVGLRRVRLCRSRHCAVCFDTVDDYSSRLANGNSRRFGDKQPACSSAYAHFAYFGLKMVAARSNRCCSIKPQFVGVNIYSSFIVVKNRRAGDNAYRTPGCLVGQCTDITIYCYTCIKLTHGHISACLVTNIATVGLAHCAINHTNRHSRRFDVNRATGGVQITGISLRNCSRRQRGDVAAAGINHGVQIKCPCNVDAHIAASGCSNCLINGQIATRSQGKGTVAASIAAAQHRRIAVRCACPCC